LLAIILRQTINPKEIHMTQTTQLPEAQRQRCEVWTRVMGYHRPVTAFNPGKQSEHRERTHFTEQAAQVSVA
jgi:anaerobic ribonucleoside-triphosphate reductase